LAVYFGGMFVSFFNPLFGVLAYLFEYYLRPSLHWWGTQHLPNWRWNLMIGSVALVTFLMRRGSLRDLPQLSNPAVRWFAVFVCSMIVVSSWSVQPAKSWQEVTDFAKLLVFYGLIVGNVRTTGAFDAFMAVNIAGAGWWGWQAYVDPTRESGRLMWVGSSDTLNDNTAAAHLLTLLPMVCIYASIAKDKRLRLLSLAAAPFIVNTFILCNSRGATVGLAVGLLTALVLARPGHRTRMLGAAVAVGAVFYVLADQTYLDRQATITDEGAGNERFATWMGAVRLLSDYPFGAGGGGFEYLSPTYIPDIVETYGERRSVHNTYMLVLTEWGIQGLVLFLGFISSTLLILRRIRKRAGEIDEFYYRSVALHVGLVATLTAAIFSNRLSGESIYWLCALSFALFRVQACDLNLAPAVEPAAAAAPSSFRPAAATGS
jgi:hypothetical protein